jgi:hypothetical protein
MTVYMRHAATQAATQLPSYLQCIPLPSLTSRSASCLLSFAIACLQPALANGQLATKLLS